MRRFCCSFLACPFLLVVFLFGGCTNGNKKGSEQVDAKHTDTSAAPSNLPQSRHVATVEIKGMKFIPEELIIQKGDTVVWINKDLTTHCITEATKAWTSATIASGSLWKRSVTENTDYYCAIHVVMKGKIKVQ